MYPLYSQLKIVWYNIHVSRGSIALKILLGTSYRLDSSTPHYFLTISLRCKLTFALTDLITCLVNSHGFSSTVAVYVAKNVKF